MGRCAWQVALAACWLASSALAAHPPKVLSFPVTRHSHHELHNIHHDDSALQLSERDETVSSTLTNDVQVTVGVYLANITVGTPGQPMSLIVDTGSSDIWVFGPNGCKASTALGGQCLGGTFDASKSSSYKLIDQGGFTIKYGQKGSHVSGDIFKDDFNIGGTTVKNMQMAVAKSTAQVSFGIMGIGFAQGESLARKNGAYPNLPMQLVNEGLVGSATYSLYLNSINDPTGNILFGGYDKSKYEGDLIPVPIISNPRTGAYEFLAIDWTGLSIDFGSGHDEKLTRSDFKEPVLLDSGTNSILLPSEAFLVIAKAFRVQPSRQLGAVLTCPSAGKPASLDFSFGGNGGPTIKVPYSQLVAPLLDNSGNPITTRSGTPVCQFRVQPNQPGLPTVFGSSLLSSAYVLYDLDKHQISLAQAKFGVKGTDIHEINYSKGSSSSSSGSGGSTSSGPPSSSSNSGSGNNGNKPNVGSITPKLNHLMLLIAAAAVVVAL